MALRFGENPPAAQPKLRFGDKPLDPAATLGVMTRRFDASPAETEAGIKASMQDNEGRVNALKAELDKSNKQSIQDRMVETFWEQPAWKRGLITLHDELGLAGSGASFGLADKAVAGMRAPFTDKTYAEELANQRTLNDNARARLNAITPGAGTFMEVAPSVMLPGVGVSKGAGLIEKGLARATEGARYGGLSWLGGDDMSVNNLGKNVALGAGLGVGGGVAADAIGTVLRGGGRVLADYVKNPSQKVWAQVSRAFNDAGVSKADVDKYIADYGPETIIADIMPGGPEQLRKAGELSPKTEKLIKDRLATRAEGANQRIADEYEFATGLPGIDEDIAGRDRLAETVRSARNRPAKQQEMLDVLPPKERQFVENRLKAEEDVFEKTRTESAQKPEPTWAEFLRSPGSLWAGAASVLAPMLPHVDPGALGAAGIGLGVKGAEFVAPAVRSALAKRGVIGKTAPAAADILTSPASELNLAPPSWWDQVSDATRDALARTATRGGLQTYGGPR